MNMNEQKILLQDLCCRLPYGVKIKIRSNDIRTVKSVNIANGVVSFLETDTISPFGLHIENPLTFKQQVKPYLRPLSAITEEEKNELKENGIKLDVCSDSKYIAYQWHGSVWEQDPLENEDINFLYHWFYKHFFDINGLIPEGLAIKAPIDMYKFE